MTTLSVLDLAPVTQGGSPAEALSNTLKLAQAAEGFGYHRYWVAEHHNMKGIASAATAVVIGHIANGTSTIRVGSGEHLLPNHAHWWLLSSSARLLLSIPGVSIWGWVGRRELTS